jgi:hypothetical protein
MLPLDSLSLSVNDVRHVSAEQWANAVDSAKKTIRESNPEPDFNGYLQSNIQDLPGWVTTPVFIGLTALALMALYVSAGKQLAASDLVFGDLIHLTDRISPLWVSTALIFMLLCGELGSLLFGLAAGIFHDKAPHRIFRAFSISSALVALGANVTMTAAHPVQTAVIFQWFITIFTPLIVLGVGFAYENMLLTYLHARVSATRQYKADFDLYRIAQRNPERDPQYKHTLFRNVLNALRDSQPNAKKKAFEYAAHTDPDFRRFVFLREYSRHTISLDVDFDNAGNPVYVQPPQTTQRQAQTRLDAAESLSSIPAVTGDDSELVQTDRQQTSKRGQALAMLQNDPGLLDMTTRELEETTGINKSAWSEAKRAYQAVEERVISND